MGRGLVCREPLEEGSPVLTVPLSLVMSGESARNFVETECNSRSSHLRDDDAIAVMLLSEKQRGEQSMWSTYIRALPKTVATLKSFSKNQLSLLKDESLAERGRRAKLTLEQSFVRVVEPILASCANQFNTFEAYLWAHSIIDSRALTFRGSRYLVPVADMVNYDPAPESRNDDNGQAFLKYHRLDDAEKTLRTFADRPCLPGDQLFEDYGDNSNAIYLEHHGFVPERNPFDCVILDLPILTRAHVEYLKALGETGPPSRCIRTVAFDPQRPSLRRYLSVSSLDDDSATRCTRAALAELQTPPGCVIDGAEDEGVAIHQLCEAVFKKMNSARSEVDGTENDKIVSTTDRLAVRYRHAQYALLANMSRECEYCLAPEKETRKNDEVLARRAADFNAWVRSRGWPDFAIEARVLSSHGGRIGAFATRSIATREAYVSVPEQDCLSAKTARADPELGPTLESFDDFHALLFLLLREVFLSEESNWAPYLALLPGVDDVVSRLSVRRRENSRERQADNRHQSVAKNLPPLMWADDVDGMRRAAKKWLRGSQLEEAVVGYFGMVRTKWEQTVASFNDSPRLQALFDDAETAVSWPVYRWAVQILDSRSIWWSGERHLVPMLDLVNAASTDELPEDATVHRTVVDEEKKVAITRAAAPFKNNDQVIEDYGQPNHVLFLYHGFALPVNKHDCVRIDLEIELPGEADERSSSLRRRLYAARFQSPRLSACVHKNMSPSQAGRVYSFLAVKHDIPLPTGPAGPSPAILRAFAEELRGRLGSYSTLQEQEESSHTIPTGAKILLANEHRLLLELYEEVTERADEGSGE